MVKVVKGGGSMVNQIHQLKQLHPLQIANTEPKKNGSVRFKEILEQNTPLIVSKHAKKRLDERNIELSEKQMQAMHAKMKEAKQKGITESLVVFNHAAFVVNTKNNTIVTAMNMEENNSKIVTNINGTILMNE